MELKSRKPTRLKEFDYNTEGAYFVTICTQGRLCQFGEIVVGQEQAPALQFLM